MEKIGLNNAWHSTKGMSFPWRIQKLFWELRYAWRRAVSEQTAAFMAEGAVALTGSDLAVSVTGLAGPDGDDRGNPVGTVFVALAHKGHYTRIYQLPQLNGSRDGIRRQVVSEVLSFVRRYLEELL